MKVVQRLPDYRPLKSLRNLLLRHRLSDIFLLSLKLNLPRKDEQTIVKITHNQGRM